MFLVVRPGAPNVANIVPAVDMSRLTSPDVSSAPTSGPTHSVSAETSQASAPSLKMFFPHDEQSATFLGDLSSAEEFGVKDDEGI